MASIGEMLTPEKKGDIIEKSLRIGDVYRMKLTQEEGISPKNKDDNSRNKFFIVIGKDNDGNAIGFVVINSNINPNLQQVIKDLYYPISASKYSFLSKDSFVNCANLKEIEKNKFSTKFDSSKNKGCICEDDLDLIIEAVRSSPLIPPKTLKRFGLL